MGSGEAYRAYIDVSKHKKTVTKPDSFYREHFDKYQFPYVRFVPNKGKHDHYALKDHTESELFGLVCISDSCGIGDVHRHSNNEVRIVEHSRGRKLADAG